MKTTNESTMFELCVTFLNRKVKSVFHELELLDYLNHNGYVTRNLDGTIYRGGWHSYRLLLKVHGYIEYQKSTIRVLKSIPSEITLKELKNL